MDADLDLLLISVYCTADDLLPPARANGRRKLSDAEVVTLCVAQVVMGIGSDRRFLRAARRQLGHLFPWLPSQSGLHKRRARLVETIEWLVGVFASDSPGACDSVVLLDSTPVECGRSVETARRSELADACGYGYSRSHSRWFWGMRLHLACAPDGTPRAATLVAADRPEREVALRLLPRARSAAAKRSSATKATQAASSQPRLPRSAPPSLAPPARTSRNQGRASRRSASESNRSSSRSKTCSASNATAHARSTTCKHGSSSDCSPSPPASASTTGSADQAARSPTTPPNRVASTI